MGAIDALDATIRVDDQLTLRLWAIADAPSIFAAVEHNRSYLRQWLPWLDNNTQVEHTRKSIQDKLPFTLTSTELVWGIWQESNLLGVLGYNHIDRNHFYGEIGYWLAADMSGQGIMTRACAAVIHYGFEHIGLHRVEITCATGNQRSRAIAERLGFTHEGTKREAEWLYDHFVDHDIYGLLAREWAGR